MISEIFKIDLTIKRFKMKKILIKNVIFLYLFAMIKMEILAEIQQVLYQIH